jgi:hypothetical protein
MCIEIGLRCVQKDRRKRPTIQNVIDMLNETETKCTYASREDWLLIYQVRADRIGKNFLLSCSLHYAFPLLFPVKENRSLKYVGHHRKHYANGHDVS